LVLHKFLASLIPRPVRQTCPREVDESRETDLVGKKTKKKEVRTK
jgi:hypothetical protein